MRVYKADLGFRCVTRGRFAVIVDLLVVLLGCHVDFGLGIDRALEVLDRLAQAVAKLRQFGCTKNHNWFCRWVGGEYDFGFRPT